MLIEREPLKCGSLCRKLLENFSSLGTKSRVRVEGIMLRQGLRIILGVMAVICIAALAAINLSNIEVIANIGKILAGDSALCFKDGQGEERLVAELLGGQEYIYVNGGGDLHESLVLQENNVYYDTSELYEVARENKTPLLGDVEAGQGEEVINQQTGAVTRQNSALVEQLKESLNVKFLWKNFYIVDSTTSVSKKEFDVKQMLEADMKMRKKSGKKQILIYHTHGASEYFKDSRKGVIEDSVVGIGDELAKELEKKGYGVYHDRTQYDKVNGGIDRSFAYNQSLDGITAIKEKYPDIEVMIDLHRDSVGKGKHTYTMIQGRKTALVMFFNGMSRTKSGPIAYLNNPNLKGNLAFSLQLKCKAMEYYDGFTKPIYLKGYRYNLHLLQKSLLIELGNENNSLEEAKNAAMPLADVLDKVLSGKG